MASNWGFNEDAARQVIFLAGLAYARVWGMGSMMSFLGGHALGSLARHSIFLIWTLPVLSAAYLGDWPLGERPAHIVTLVLMVLQEVWVGTLLGFTSMVPFWAIDFGCFLIDTLRGSSMAAALNPTLGSQSSGLGIFFTQLLAVLFLSSGGLDSLLSTLYLSYRGLPLGAPVFLSLTGWKTFLKQQFTLMFDLGLSFSLPSLVIMVLIDIAMGLLNLGVSQMNIFFLAMPIKSSLCLMLLAISLNFSLATTLEAMRGTWTAWTFLLSRPGGG